MTGAHPLTRVFAREDPRFHFDLGSHDRVALLEVARTDSTTVRLENVKVDQIVQINEMIPPAP
jgi:hypothetical protein